MDDDKRDELLIRLDERTSSMADGIKDLKSDFKAESASTHSRLDILETRMPPRAVPALVAPVPPSGEANLGAWAALLEFVAAAPAAWHIIASVGLSLVGGIGMFLMWVYKHGGGK